MLGHFLIDVLIGKKEQDAMKFKTYEFSLSLGHVNWNESSKCV